MAATTGPVYLRVLEDLRERIRGGLLAPGARVPSRNAIIAKYGVGETAAKHALQVLATEGLIEARAGSGSGRGTGRESVVSGCESECSWRMSFSGRYLVWVGPLSAATGAAVPRETP